MCIICGIDPGITGSLAFVDTNNGSVITVYPMPVITKEMSTKTKSGKPKTLKRINGAEVWSLLVKHKTTQIFLEDVWSSPGQGVASAFSFGDGFGAVRTACQISGADVFQVAPAKWKPALNVPADKDAARNRATELFGDDQWWPLKKDHGKAEAALLAYYGMSTGKKEPNGRK